MYKPTFHKLFLLISLLSFLISYKTWAQCPTLITSFPYQEDFELNDGGWTTGQSGATLSDWTWGHPTKTYINTAGSGNKCWISGGLTTDLYNNGELSWLKTPCFNFTSILHPYIRFKIYWESEKKFDGAVLQYSANSGTSWTNVGAITDPVDCLNTNWFNTPAVTWLKPPLVIVNQGWSGTHVQTGACPSSSGSLGWVNAQHCMPSLVGAPTVVFRFVFGSGTTCNNFDGIAIDSVFIGEAPAINANFSHSCANSTTVNFTDLSSNCPNVYAWNFGDAASGINNTSNTAGPTHIFSGPGVYHVTLNASNSTNNNLGGSITQDITILGLTPTVISPITCTGNNNGSLTVTVNSGSNPGPFSYSWNTTPVQITQTAINLGPGTYTITVGGTGANSAVCPKDTSITITAPNPVVPTFTAISPQCQGSVAPLLPATSLNGISGTWNPLSISTAAIGTAIYTFTPAIGLCATTITMSVTVNPPSIIPTFTQIAAFCNGGSFTLPVTSNNGITGTWLPAINNNATTTYTFTPNAGQCAITASMTVTVNQPVTPTFTQVPAICTGTSFTLPATSNNGITGTWSPAINNTVTTIYTFTPNAGQCASTTTMTIVVNPPNTLPIFTQLSAICNGGLITLPGISINGITGTWSPVINNTATTTYTFTPNAGQCAIIASMIVTVNQPLTPIFTQVAAICNGAAFTLPSTSNNGITGTWSPAINNTATTTYSFTPNAGQCAISASMTVTVNQSLTPTFTQVTTICNGGSFSLPITSNNGITGTWSPAINNTATTTYTFTPNAGQCAITASMTVTVNQPVTPTFTQVPAICADTSFTLPAASNNGIIGIWSPAINNSATTTYTFTPNVNQCAVSANMTVTVNQLTTPTFTQVAPICSGTSFTLPATSNNGITGTWSPAINNTITTIYTFTPNAGQCATITTMSVNVNAQILPSFSPFSPICQGSAAPLLAATSNNGINGTWNPSLINTNNAGNNQYIFTPANGLCASTYLLTVTILQKPTTPSTIDGSRCIPGQVDLSAVSNDTVKWYSDILLTQQIAIGNHYNPFINSTSIFYVTSTNSSGCTSSPAIVRGTIQNIPVPVFLGKDSAICPNTTLMLNPGNYAHYLWQDMSIQPTYIVLNSGVYYVTVTDINGCTGSDTIRVEQLINCNDIFFPNAFTPNGDGVNDGFGPIGNVNFISDYSLYIFNRWGQLVFSSSNPRERWTGKYKEELINNSNFCWIATYRFKNSTSRQQKGNLLLIK